MSVLLICIITSISLPTLLSAQTVEETYDYIQMKLRRSLEQGSCVARNYEFHVDIKSGEAFVASSSTSGLKMKECKFRFESLNPERVDIRGVDIRLFTTNEEPAVSCVDYQRARAQGDDQPEPLMVYSFDFECIAGEYNRDKVARALSHLIELFEGRRELF